MINRWTGAVYLYCLAPSSHPPAPEGFGVDGESPLFLYGFASVTAVVSGVRLDEFCGQEAETRLQDLAWIGPRACRHEAVVEEVMEHSAVFPIPFGTIFSSLEGLEEFLRTHHDRVALFLGQMNGREEWAVKGLLDTAKATNAFLAAALDLALPEHKTLPPGKRYLAEKRLQREAEQAMRSWLNDLCQELENDLRHYAPSFRHRQLLSREASGMEAEMIANWALLVPKSHTAEVQALIEHANAAGCPRGLHFQLSGPWPPYSFRPVLAPESRG